MVHGLRVGMAALALLATFGLGLLAHPCTVTVQEHHNLQHAIEMVPEGGVVCLAAGEWETNLVIEKSLTLRAAEIEPEPVAVIRSARLGWPVIRIASEEPIEVTVQGLKITGALGGCYQREPELICASGISLHGKTTATVEGNIINDNAMGIFMCDSAQATVESNIISETGFGIRMADSSSATVEKNTISDNGHGIVMSHSSQATIEGNTISDNRWNGIMMSHSSQATIENNTISDNVYGIVMRDSAQAMIEGNTISDNNGYGIEMWDSAQATIEGNTISGNERDGILMELSSQATIEGNTISDNRNGIVMLHFSKATIEGNVIRDNEGYGVVLRERPCVDIDRVFTGYVTGRENTGGGNADGDYCPDTLAFLFTEEGGELDQREEE